MPSGRVLMVDDDEAIRLLVRETLGAEGHEVLEAVDGPSALPAAREHRPDVVLLDVGLPGIDGLDVLAQLKADEELREVPVMMMSSWADPALVVKAIDRGAADHLRKPFDGPDLERKVAALLEPATDVDAALREGAAVRFRAGELDEAIAAAVERRLRIAARGGDVVAREADGTFVVVVRGADERAAATVGQRLQAEATARPVNTPAAAVRVQLEPVGQSE